MKEIHKIWKIKGLMNKPSTMETYGVVPLFVNLTRDEVGCSLSIGSEMADLQFTIPMEFVLKELRGDTDGMD